MSQSDGDAQSRFHGFFHGAASRTKANCENMLFLRSRRENKRTQIKSLLDDPLFFLGRDRLVSGIGGRFARYFIVEPEFSSKQHMFIKQKLHIDDSLDVFPVHDVGGGLGTILDGVFSSSSLAWVLN